MRQTIHIFRKDALYLWKELALLVAMLVLFCWAHTHPHPEGLATSNQVLLLIAAAYVIARLVQAEAIPGDRQFWLTRPYNWKSLLAAKLLGLLVFVNLPVFAARVYVYHANGFPDSTTLGPLLWSQLLIFASLTLPVAAVAALTANLVSFTFAALGFAVCAFAVDEGGFMLPSAGRSRVAFGEWLWVWNSLLVGGLIAMAIPVLYLQYKRRSTMWSRTLAVGLAVAVTLAYSWVPWPVAAAVQTSVSKPGFDPRLLQIGLGEIVMDSWLFNNSLWQRAVGVQIPIRVSGVPLDAEAVPDAVTLSFETGKGERWAPDPRETFAISKKHSGLGPAALSAQVQMPYDFFEKAKADGLKVKGKLYLTMFGNAQSRTIPLSTNPIDALEGLQCASLHQYDVVLCRAPFRWPGKLVYAKFGRQEMVPFTRSVSYSPFPAGLDLLPITSETVRVPADAREVTIVVEDRLASFRRDFELDNFPLVDLSVPLYKYIVPTVK